MSVASVRDRISAFRASGSAYAWYVVFVLFLAYMISAVDRQILTLMVPNLKADMDLSDTQISLLLGFAFALLYSIAGFPIGRMADRKSRRGIIAIGISIWCLMTVMCGLARNFGQLFLARVGVGVGEASLSPSAYSLIADYFVTEKRPMAFSVFHLGYPIGGGLAIIVGGMLLQALSGIDVVSVPLLGELRSWQLAFVIVGLPGFLVALLVLTIREPQRTGMIASDDGVKEVVSVGELFEYMGQRWKVYTAHFSAVSLLGLLAIGSAIWYPTFLMRTYDYSQGDVAKTYGVIYLVCGIIGTLSGGWFAGLLSRRGYIDANWRLMLIATILKITPLVVGPLMPTPVLALSFVAVAQVIGQMSQGVSSAALQEITPNQMRGQVVAIFLFLVNVIGLGIGASFIAAITDYGFGYDGALRYSISIAAGVIGPVIVVILLWGMKHYRAAVIESREWQEVTVSPQMAGGAPAEGVLAKE